MKQLFLPKELRQKQVDAVLYTYPIVAYFSRLPSCTLIYDTLFVAEPTERSVRNSLASILVRGSAQRSSRIITISEFSKREIVKFLRVPAPKIQVAYPGCDHIFQNSTHKPSSPAVAEMLSRKFILSVLGSFVRRKNAPTLVEAFRMLPSDLKRDYNLVIVAQKCGQDWPVVRRQLVHTGLAAKVVILGALGFSDLLHLYRAAELVLHPTRYEGFGLPVLEAMASGTPVIASNRGAISEIAGDAAILVDPEQPEEIATAVCGLASSQEQKQLMVSRGLQRSRFFSWRNMASTVLQTLEQARYSDGAMR